ncbi:MAG: glycosyltransferase family 1 protein [Proteobacteria bacterium]|nr:glycosyltransferase family 1 protein [Pseudomonadota bacterium]
MRIAIATDAWAPQVNGVVTTLTQTRDHLSRDGHEVLMVTNEGRRTFACPTYPEIRLTLFAGRRIARELDAFEPDCVHVATEGTIGLSVRRYCIERGIPFTTAYHTQLPEYVRARFPIPVRWTVALMRWFHKPAVRTMVPTMSMRRTLLERGFGDVVIWSRGVLTDVFTPEEPVEYEFDGPVWVYFGRVAVEKNIEAFLDLSVPGAKIVIGDGPDRERLQANYPDCHFLGYKFGRDLARHVAGADVFVFPSRTDTFGIVMLEAMACGVPVAAYPVTGPVDVVKPGVTGCLHDDLTVACSRALELNRRDCRQYAESRSWGRSTRQFVGNLAPRDPFPAGATVA